MTQHQGDALRSVFEAVHPLRYAVLRNAETLPDSVPGTDIDVIVDRRDLRALLATIAAGADAAGWRVAWTYDKALRIRHLVLTPCTGEPHVIRFDVSSVAGWGATRLFDAGDLLPSRIERRGVWQLDDVAAATVAVLGRWLHRGEAPEAYLAAFDLAREVYPERVAGLLTIPLGQSLAEEIVAGNRPTTERVRSAARRHARRHPLAWLRDRAWYARFVLGRCLRPPGRFVVFLGAHGSGKSTLVEGVAEAARAAVPRVRVLHLRPRWLPDLREVRRRILRRPSVARVEVHLSEIPEASRAGSTVRLLYYAVDYVLGYARRVAPVRVRAGLVIADRWHYDFAVDQASKRIGLPPALVRGLLRVLPRPDLVILVSTPGAVAEARRPAEIDAAEADRQTAAFRALLVSLGHPFVEIDASTDPGSATTQAWRATLACLAGDDTREASR